MTKFLINANEAYYALSTFARGYLEAAFFTNGDSGDENEFSLNELGVDALTVEALETIRQDCNRFVASLPQDGAGRTALDLAYDYSPEGYDEAQAGRDFWFSRQGHGVGFWDRGLGEVGDRIDTHATTFGETGFYVGDDGHIHSET